MHLVLKADGHLFAFMFVCFDIYKLYALKVDYDCNAKTKNEKSKFSKK